jgi:hypothetical protein
VAPMNHLPSRVRRKRRGGRNQRRHRVDMETLEGFTITPGWATD